MKYIVGIDEVGRGPLAGPVAVAAFCVEARIYKNLLKEALLPNKDSKKLSEHRREAWENIFKKRKQDGQVNYAISMISAELIDRRGISWAIRTALARSLGKIDVPPAQSMVFLDGGLCAPKEFKNQDTVIGGDAKIPVIACASIVAKVARDRKMERYATQYPMYGFAAHKGYGTAFHRNMIRRYGPSILHRKSFLTRIPVDKTI